MSDYKWQCRVLSGPKLSMAVMASIASIASMASIASLALGISILLMVSIISSRDGNAAQTAAQQYPTKPIRMIVPYPPGAGTEFTAREIGRSITEATGQPVVMDHRPGAGATLGHAIAARAVPDGYTLMLGTIGGLVSGPALLGNKIPYDPLVDFSPIGLATFVPYCLIVNSQLPVNSVREFITLAKSQPGKLNFSSPGIGTPNHIGGAMLMTLAGLDLVHVPYKGSSMSLAELISGTIHLTITGLLTVQPYVKSGRMKVLGVGHTQRIKWAPDLPAINETIPGYYNTGWWGLVGPAKLPKPIIRKLGPIMTKWLQMPETVQRFQVVGLEVATTSPEGFQEMIKSDLQTWRKLIKDSKITVDSMP
jgi:tripartite-type tricarboxylate transporter receptor subunit TctC